MSSNISDPLPKKSDNPGENIRKTSGDLDETKKALVTTTDTVVKKREYWHGWQKNIWKPNVVKEAINPHI